MGLLLKKPTRWGIGFAALLAALVVTISLAANASAKPHRFYGVVSQTSLSGPEIAKMAEARIGTLRALMHWAAIDPSAAPDDYQWGAFDTLVADAAVNGVEVLPFVYGTPAWVARGLDHRNCSVCDAYAPKHKQALLAWRDFVAAAVSRYGRQGTFWAEHPELPRKPIRAWQIWNEQNSKTFYAPRPSVKGYATLLGAAQKAVHKNDRSADVILGGMAELSGSSKAVPGPKYLRKFYRRHGVEHDFDAIAVHPYGAKAKSVEQQVERFRAESVHAHDKRVGLWITETGWGSSNGSNPLEVGKHGQAQRLHDVYKYLTAHRSKLHIKGVIWFSWRDSGQSICAWCASSGLLKQNGRPKPAYRTLKRLAH